MGSSPVEVAGRARVLMQEQHCIVRMQRFLRRRNHGGVGTFVGVRLSFTMLALMEDGRVPPAVSLP